MRWSRHSEALLWTGFGGIAFIALGIAVGQQPRPTDSWRNAVAREEDLSDA